MSYVFPAVQVSPPLGESTVIEGVATVGTGVGVGVIEHPYNAFSFALVLLPTNPVPRANL